MTHTFDDIVFMARGREYAYRAHMLETDMTTHNGFATAALVAVWMLGSEEGERRGVDTLSTPEERARLMDRYETETFSEDGGLLLSEIEAVYWWLWHLDDEDAVCDRENKNNDNDEAILQLGTRQVELWSQLINEYMTRLVDRWAETTLADEDNVNDADTYLEFLLEHLGAYSRIRHMRQIRWCDRYSVEEFWALSDCNPGWITEHIELKDIITHLPDEVNEKALMERYFALRKSELAQRPTKPTSAEWYAKEQQPLASEIQQYLCPKQLSELEEYHKTWLRYLSNKLMLVPGSQVPVIWTEKVNDALEEKLIAYLTIQEGTRAWARNMRAALFAMQQMDWVRKDLTIADFRRWASKYLQRNYTQEASRVALSKWWYEWSKDDDTIVQHHRRLREI